MLKLFEHDNIIKYHGSYFEHDNLWVSEHDHDHTLPTRRTSAFSELKRIPDYYGVLPRRVCWRDSEKHRQATQRTTDRPHLL